MKKLTSSILIIAMVAFFSFGCESLNTNTAKGSLIGGALGAGAGAIIGAQTGHAGIGTAIGAGIGALAGGGIGYWMDKQQKELQTVIDQQNAQQAQLNAQQTQIQQTQTKVAELERKGDSIIMNFSGDTLFDTNSSVLHPGAINNLKQIATILKRYPDTNVTIKGHTDSTGSADYNQKLSQQRADAVKPILLGEGIVPERIATIGYGASFPIASNDTPEGRQLNRRVEMEIKPKEQQQPQQQKQG